MILEPIFFICIAALPAIICFSVGSISAYMKLFESVCKNPESISINILRQAKHMSNVVPLDQPGEKSFYSEALRSAYLYSPPIHSDPRDYESSTNKSPSGMLGNSVVSHLLDTSQGNSPLRYDNHDNWNNYITRLGAPRRLELEFDRVGISCQ